MDALDVLGRIGGTMCISNPKPIWKLLGENKKYWESWQGLTAETLNEIPPRFYLGEHGTSNRKSIYSFRK